MVFKFVNLNTRKEVHAITGNSRISNRDKAFMYDVSECISGGCYKCLNCDWIGIDD